MVSKLVSKYASHNLVSPLGAIPPGWDLVRLGEVTTKIGSGATPRGGSEVYLPCRKNFAFIRSQNVFDRYFDENGLVFISDEHARHLSSVWLQEDDILLNITGDGVTFGRSCIVPVHILPACVNQHVAILRCNPDNCDAGYLISYLTHPLIKDYIESFNAGGSRRAITKGHIQSFLLPLPPLRAQQAISTLLGALDDKIDLNRRMNETLEAMARALFQSWFVDFDPVRAKMDGRQPAGMDAETAALFPSEFEMTVMGDVPGGWQVGPFSKAIDLISGGTPKTSIDAYWNGDIPWFSVVDAPSSADVFVMDTEKKITMAGLESSSTRLLGLGTTIITARGTVGKVALVGVPMAMNQSCYGIVGREDRAPYYTYYSVRFLISELQRRTHGSVFDTITRSTFDGIDWVLAPVALTRCFDAMVAPFMDRILVNLRQSHTLATIRDALLPKLLSGEIRVTDAESLVEAAI